MKKVLNAVVVVLSIAVIAFLLASFAGFLPIKFFNVISGSMEPTIPTGSIVAAYELNPNDVIVGDVVMFIPRETNMVMHRVVDIVETESGREFITRGDANNTNDPVPIYPQEIIGKVFFFLPGVGDVTAWIRENLIAFIAFSLALMFGAQAVVNYISNRRSEKIEEVSETPSSTK